MLKLIEVDSEAMKYHSLYRSKFLSMSDILFGTSDKYYAEYKRLVKLRDGYIDMLNNL